MEEKKSVKELKELLIALQVLAVFAKKVAADKTVNLADLPYLVDLSKQFDSVLAGFNDLGAIPDEVKDIDESEAMELLGVLFKVIKEVKAA